MVPVRVGLQTVTLGGSVGILAAKQMEERP
jgi:hypothetical protein